MPFTKLFPETKLSDITGKLFTRIGGDYDPVSPVIHRRRKERTDPNSSGRRDRNDADVDRFTNHVRTSSRPIPAGGRGDEGSPDDIMRSASIATNPPGLQQPSISVTRSSEHREREPTIQNDERSPLLGRSATDTSMKEIGAQSSEDATTRNTFSVPQPRGQWVTTANQTLEGLDIDEFENQILQDEREKRRGHLDPPAWKVWIIIILIGACTGIVALGIDEGVSGLFKIKFAAVEKYMHTSGSNLTREENPNLENLEISFAAPYFLFVVINVVYVAVAAVLVVWGEPLAKGSGIPEIKCYLNGIRVYRVVRLKTLCCKAIGILFSVASGLPCGKEGPMIHSGAAIASGISTGKSSKLHFDTGLMKEFRSDSEKRNFVTAGAAAGVAAAFGAPIGGVLFAVEEVGSFWKIEITVMVFVCAAISPWVLQVLHDPSQFTTGNIKGQIDFGRVEGTYHYYDIPFLFLLGALGGLLGSFFIAVNMKITRWRKQYNVTKLRKFAEVLVVSVMVSSTLIILVLRGYKCVDEPAPGSSSAKLLDGKLKGYGCPKGEYNDMATYFFHSLEESISLLIKEENSIHYSSLLKQWIPFFFLTIVTYGIHVPSGLFLPTIALGANLGRLYAQMWNVILPESSLLPPNSYALFGAAAMLGGCVRMTISIIVIIMECTANTSYFYPLCIIAIAAKAVGDRFNHGIYEEHVRFARIPLLEGEMERGEMYRMRAGDIMNPSIVKLPLMVAVGELIYMLKTHPQHNVYVVTDIDGTFRGLLLRRQAIILIHKRAWEKPLVLEDFEKTAKERELLKIKKYGTIEIQDQHDLIKKIDLLPYIDQWPYTFLATTPVTRLHSTMRAMCLRHMVIIDEGRRPLGIVGRKQLTWLEYCEHDHLDEVQDTLGGCGGANPSTGKLSPRSPCMSVQDIHNGQFTSFNSGGSSGLRSPPSKKRSPVDSKEHLQDDDDDETPNTSDEDAAEAAADDAERTRFLAATNNMTERDREVLLSVKSLETEGWGDAYKKHVN